ncbi:hypothetical protein ES708_29498 [subsurface metagenome]
MDVGSDEGWSSGWRAGQSFRRDGLVGYRTGDTHSFGVDTTGEEAQVE